MFTFNRKEQIALLLLSAALLIGAIISYIDSRNPHAISDFHVVKSAVPVPDGPDHDAPQELIDINRATAEELQALPGIGPQLAQRIVEYREQHGPFPATESLRAVRGIGEKMLERVKPHIAVTSP